MAAGQRLQLFVRIGQAVAAHHRLHGFGQHFPGGVEVGGEPLRIDAELAQAAQQRIEADQRMAERGAQRAQHGRIGQVALPAADRQLGGEMFEQRVGDAEVAFGILEVDRVDLVRHGRTADFAGLDRLLEVAERDVAPDVAAQVDADGVDAALRVAEFGDAVVRLDLGGVGLPVQAQRLHEAPRERRPVDVRIGGDVRVVVADRAVDLARHRQRGQHVALALQAGDDVGQFLADGGRRGGLAVRARQHRQRGVRVRHRRAVSAISSSSLGSSTLSRASLSISA